MKLEAVVVCINYGDFLAVTLPANKGQFDRMVVVTTPDDIETIEVCKKNGVKWIETNDVYKDGPVANKAIAINKGLDYLSKDGWVLQLDADIWLPPMTRAILEKLPLNDDSIYGIDRYMCDSYKEWYTFINNNKEIYGGYVFMNMSHFKIGHRVNQYYGDGYMPIGFFQLWNPSKSGTWTYPVELSGYDRTDVVHLKQFARDKRKFIPELVCVHLASETTELGQNWKGRKTKRFEMPNIHDLVCSEYVVKGFADIPKDYPGVND